MLAPHYNPRCADCRFASHMADDAPGADQAVARCTEPDVVGYWRGVTQMPLKWVAVKLDRDCKKFAKRRKAPVRRDKARAGLFGREA